MSKTKDTKGNKEGDEDQEVLLSNRKTSQKQEMRESNSKDKNGERSTTITSQSKSLQSSEKDIVREQKQKQTGTRIEGTNIKTRHQIEMTRELDRKEEERRNNGKYVRVISYHPARLIQVMCITAFTQYNIRLASTCVVTPFHI